jgi:hypothetical protein
MFSGAVILVQAEIDLLEKGRSRVMALLTFSISTAAINMMHGGHHLNDQLAVKGSPDVFLSQKENDILNFIKVDNAVLVLIH